MEVPFVWFILVDEGRENSKERKGRKDAVKNDAVKGSESVE